MVFIFLIETSLGNAETSLGDAFMTANAIPAANPAATGGPRAFPISYPAFFHSAEEPSLSLFTGTPQAGISGSNNIKILDYSQY